MRRPTVDAEALGPWSLGMSRAFRQGFGPSALNDQRAGDGIRTVFRVEADWSRVEVEINHNKHLATIAPCERGTGVSCAPRSHVVGTRTSSTARPQSAT